MSSSSETSVADLEALNRELDEALGLLRLRRYAELQHHLLAVEARANGLVDSGALIELRGGLSNGSLAGSVVRETCDRLDRRLHVFSEVARQVMQVELGMTQIVEMPAEGAYGRDGQCGDGAGRQVRNDHIRHEA